MKNNNNLYVYEIYRDTPQSPELIINFIAEDYPEFEFFKTTEIFNQRIFFPRNLTLLQTLDFHCNIHGKSLQTFLTTFNYEQLTSSINARKINKDLDRNLKNIVSFHLYTYLNEFCIFYNFSLPNLMKSIKDNHENQSSLVNILDTKNIIYIETKKPKKYSIKHIQKYFNIFACIEGNDVKYFDNVSDLLGHIN
jgi:hypothetical protein